MTPDTLQWLGCAFAVTGSLLLARHTNRSGWGFVLFLISNVFWIAYGIEVNARGILVMQMFFSVTSLIGIYRWFGLSFCAFSRFFTFAGESQEERVNSQKR